MRDECAHLKGRRRDLCEGRGIDGRTNPRQEDCDRQRLEMGLEVIVVQEPQGESIPGSKTKAKQRSQIGTRLSKLFRERIGQIPCGWCREQIEKLNGMTADEVRANRAVIIDNIRTNAENSASWWLRFTVHADAMLHLGGAVYLIGKYLDESIGAESIVTASPAVDK